MLLMTFHDDAFHVPNHFLVSILQNAPHYGFSSDTSMADPNLFTDFGSVMLSATDI